VYLILICIGAVLRIWQGTADTSLYIDEIAVARDVLQRPVLSLVTRPLPDQVAPKGFLLALKVAVKAFGPTDLALRMYSLVASVASLLLFWRLAVQLHGGAGPMAMALFASAIPLVSFGSQAKQYSGDVFTTVLLLWLAVESAVKGKESLRWRWFAGLAGALAVWFSHPAALVAISLAAVVMWLKKGMNGKGTKLIPVLGLWGVSAAAATADAVWSVAPEMRVYVQQVWAPGFLPLPPTRAVAMLWPWDQIKALLGRGLPASLTYPEPGLYFVLILVGFWILWRRQRTLAYCLLAPVAVTLGAAVAHRYPFADRLILFLVPILLLALGSGIETVREWVSRGSHSFWFKAPGWLAYGALGGAAFWPIIRTPPVYHVEDMKPVLAYLQSQRRPADRIYTYYGAAPATAFYAGRYGLHDRDYAVGGCHRGEGRRYLEELDTFRGSPRVWVVLTHSLPAFQEREDLLRYLDAIGVRRQGFAVSARTLDNRGFPAEVYLYDLSDPIKLARVAATSFPLLGPISRDAHSRCLFGPQVMIPPRGI
jgi:hypothetical protein